MDRLDEIRGEIVNELKQWNSSIINVKHTITHVNNEIRDSTWGFKLLKEAREELNILEKSKPSFEVDFKLNNGIKEVIANLGEVSIKQTNKQPESEFIYKPDSSDNMGWESAAQCPILPSQFEDRPNISRETIGEMKWGNKIESGTKIQIVPIENVLLVDNKNMYKLPRSNSCGGLNAKHHKHGTPNTPLDDLSISEDMSVQLQKTTDITEPNGFVWHRGVERIQTETRINLKIGQQGPFAFHVLRTNFPNSEFKII